jgi:alkanesulfonate monooxygenase SsuD/methylene tetrahydromethanopterin reductase-like flavin-dependent oxidoreductase (luciferase family)
VRDRMVFGTPQECVETIGRFRDQAGVDDFLMIFRYPTGPDHAAVLEAMELFAAEVRPALEQATAAV